MTGRNITALIESQMGAESLALLRRLGELADDRGTAAYVVGGVVRDLLLGLFSEDLDIVVEESGEAFAESAAAELGGSVKAHTRFGTAILVLPGGRKIDVATSRSEAYERPGALPTVRSGDIREDLRRRDFTVNSMAVRIGPRDFGELVDLYSGENDLRAGVLKILTDVSFSDDPTRVLRGVRFCARFGFELEERSERLLREAVGTGGLSTVSGERIMNEIVLILRERSPWPPVARLIEWGILPAIEEGWALDGGLERTFDDIGELLSTPAGRDVVDSEDGWRVYFLAMVQPLPHGTRTAVLERLRAGRRLRELAQGLELLESSALPALSLEGELRRSEVCRAASPVDPVVLALNMATERGSRAAGRIDLYLSELRHVRASVGGDDLARLGVSEGRCVGEILGRLREARLDGEVSTDEEELELAARLAKDLDARNKNC